LKLYLNFQRELTETELQAIRELVKRRSRREPLQHIVGTTSFCGLEIRCSPSAVVPRPETELLAERACQFIHGRPSQHPLVLDIGTGTGCIAIAVAKNAPNARVIALDISEEALDLARDNAQRNSVGEQIDFRREDMRSFHGAGAESSAINSLGPAPGPFDLVVSNPPYIESDEIPLLQPEVRDFDPRLALDGGPDGLNFYREIASRARGWVLPDAKVMAEFGDGQAEAVKKIFERENWVVEEIVADYSPRPRILIGRRASQQREPRIS
jgi:release factor glutamine methyltransferase